MRTFVVGLFVLSLTASARADDVAPRVALTPEARGVEVATTPDTASPVLDPAVGQDDPLPAPSGDLRDEFDDLAQPSEVRAASTSGLLALLLKTMFMLAIVVGIAYLTLHKGVGKMLARAQQGQRIKVIERVPLGERRSLYLVTVDGRELLLGVGEGGISTLDAPRAHGDAQSTESERGRFASLVDGQVDAQAAQAATTGSGRGAATTVDDERRTDG